MKFISHRGNITGKNIDRENDPEYINEALSLGYDVEVDVWYVEYELYLGHDEPQYNINLEWLYQRFSNLWVHCKNLESIEFFRNLQDNPLHYFWHQDDDVTLTSKGHLWVYPAKQPIKNSIAVLPEKYDEDVSGCYGVCSDVIENFKS